MKVAIISEGFQGTGYGHLTRCLSIYQAFEENNITPLYFANCDDPGKNFIPDVNLLQLNWLQDTGELLKRINGFNIAIIDSYLAPLETYEQIYFSVKKVVYIDDYIRLDYPPGIVLNGTIGAEKLPYKKDDKHSYLLGVDYMPLRKEFWDVEVPIRENKEIKNVLITFGAQDLRNLTNKVLSHLLKEFPQFNYHIVTGSNNAEKIEQGNVTYHNLLNASGMLNLMIKCDLAVTAAGQTTYEHARVGLPTIIIGVINNQKYNIKGWLESGFLKQEIWLNNKNLLKEIGNQINMSFSQKFNKLIDGQGARRFINLLM